MADGFHMLQLQLSLPGLMELARRRRLPPHEVDEGYLVHSALGELFGEARPRPFAMTERFGRDLTVLGYADRPAEALAAQAQAVADPAAYALCRWDRFLSKPMPARWAPETTFTFRVRTCPVVRKSAEGAHHQAGAELDLFLDRCLTEGPEVEVDREAVYRQWFADQVARQGGATVESCGLRAFRRVRLTRRRSDRKTQILERPDALLEGRLRVEDPEAFDALVRRGIGRHRGFGFGMLLLRPS